MFKYIFIILLTFLLSHCALNNSTSNLNVEYKNKDITKINFDNDLPFYEFKKNVIKYGELSDYPKLD